MFNGPIPGQSLTTPPKNYPWERPPEFTKPQQVIEYYLDKLSKEDAIESALDMLELGMDIKSLVSGITRVGVSKGLHTIDLSLLAAPVIHEYIKTAADLADIEYDEGFENRKQKEELQYQRNRMKAKKILEKLDARPLVEEEDQMAIEDTAPAETVVEEPKGFVRRRK